MKEERPKIMMMLLNFLPLNNEAFD